MPTLEASQFISNNFSKYGNANTRAFIIIYFTNWKLVLALSGHWKAHPFRHSIMGAIRELKFLMIFFIKRCKTIKTMNIVDVFRCWPLNNCRNLTLISLNTINKHNKAQVSVKNLHFFWLTYSFSFLKVLKQLVGAPNEILEWNYKL